MDLLDLKYLVILSELRNFGRAAAELGVNTSTLSRRVARLEDQLGALIFERTRTGAIPTPVGQELLKCARRALAEIDALKHVAKSNSSAQHGALRLATQISIIANQFKAWLVEWQALHPTINLQLWEMNDREILTALNSRQVDVGVLLAPLVSGRVESLALFSERLMLAVNDTHPLSSHAGVLWKDMQHLKLLVRSWDGSQAYREIQAGLIGSHAEFRPQHASYLALLGLVSMAEGASIVLESHASIGYPSVMYLPIDEPDANVSISLAWSRDIEDPVVGNFVAFMRDRAQPAEAVPLSAAAPLQMPDPLP